MRVVSVALTVSGRGALGVALALVTVGCEASPDAGVAGGAQTEDSAGVVIVRNARPTSDSRLEWQVGSEPVVSIGAIEGREDFQLHRVDDGLKLADGRIVVANGGSHQLFVFDEDGSYLTSWGQRGEGPGDFGGAFGSDGLGSPQLFWIEPWAGDSLAICHGTYSGGSHLVALWDDQGNHGRTVDLARSDGMAVCRDVLQNGAILASRPASPLFTPPDPAEADGLVRADHEFSVVPADGSSSVSLGPHGGNETFWHLKGETPFVLLDPPFTKTLVWAAWRDLVIVSPTDHYEIRAYRNDGSRRESSGANTMREAPHRPISTNIARSRRAPAKRSTPYPSPPPSPPSPPSKSTSSATSGSANTTFPKTGIAPSGRSSTRTAWRWDSSRHRRSWSSMRSAKTTSWAR